MAQNTQLIQGQSTFQKLMTISAMLCAFAFLAILGWYASKESSDNTDYNKLPLIKADNTAFKVKPSNPGGMQVDNENIKLYQEITNDISTKRTDVIDLSDAKLSPPPEEPIKIIAVTPEETSQVADTQIPTTTEPMNNNNTITDTNLKETPLALTPEMQKIAIAIAQQNDINTATEEAVTETISTVSTTKPAIVPVRKPNFDRPEAKIVTVIQTTPTKRVYATKTSSSDPRYTRILLSNVPQKPNGHIKPQSIKYTQPPTEPTKIKQVTKVQKTNYNIAQGSQLIQLGSFRSRNKAQNSWALLQNKYPKELGRLSLAVKKVDLGTKGIYYRLLVGSFSNKTTALKACKTLIRKGQDCLVAR